MSTLKWSEWLAAADDQGFSAIPAGDYELYVDSATATQAQSSGKDMIKLKFKVESGPHEGASVFSNLVISPESPAALSFLIRKLSAFGLDREYLAKNPSLEQIASDLEHRRVLAKVIIRPYNGEDRNDVDTLRPPADGVTHRASGPIPEAGLGMFGTNVSTAKQPAHHHAGKAPDLPF
jgi:hypothetical protein